MGWDEIGTMVHISLLFSITVETSAEVTGAYPI